MTWLAANCRHHTFRRRKNGNQELGYQENYNRDLVTPLSQYLPKKFLNHISFFVAHALLPHTSCWNITSTFQEHGFICSVAPMLAQVVCDHSIRGPLSPCCVHNASIALISQCNMFRHTFSGIEAVFRRPRYFGNRAWRRSMSVATTVCSERCSGITKCRYRLGYCYRVATSFSHHVAFSWQCHDRYVLKSHLISNVVNT